MLTIILYLNYEVSKPFPHNIIYMRGFPKDQKSQYFNL